MARAVPRIEHRQLRSAGGARPAAPHPRVAREGDALLLGTDLVKPPRELLLAYDDPLQVTAAFNRNLLRRINDELGGTFDLDGFAHRAVWNPQHSRVEMHLVSTRQQLVRIAAADLEIKFQKDEWIWTESSYKYEPEQVLAEGRHAGFQQRRAVDRRGCAVCADAVQG